MAKRTWNLKSALSALGEYAIYGARVVLVSGRNLTMTQLSASDYLAKVHGFYIR